MTDPANDDLSTEPAPSMSEADGANDGNLSAEPASGGTPSTGGPPEGSAVPDDPEGEITVEDLVANLEAVTVERDTYLDGMRRLQAEFENYRKAVVKRESDARERANESLVNELLPVLDACDGAVANGAADVSPIRTSLLDQLAKLGLERIDEPGAPFDPEQHEAVMHEPAEESGGDRPSRNYSGSATAGRVELFGRPWSK